MTLQDVTIAPDNSMNYDCIRAKYRKLLTHTPIAVGKSRITCVTPHYK